MKHYNIHLIHNLIIETFLVSRLPEAICDLYHASKGAGTREILPCNVTPSHQKIVAFYLRNRRGRIPNLTEYTVHNSTN
jgi:hypothetical protein